MKKLHVAGAISALFLLALGVSLAFGGFIPLNDMPTTPTATPTPVPTPTQASSATSTAAPTVTTQPNNSPIIYTYQIVNIYPHDTEAFTQGIVFDNGTLLESTGGWGTSYLRRVDIESGTVVQECRLSDEFFGEGLAKIDDKLVQLTWLNNLGLVYDSNTFELLGNFSYPTQGWGLSFDGQKLIMSDGSSTLYFLDPITYDRIGQLNVVDGDIPIANINEMEYINGDIYANIWKTQKIAIINPQTGQVKGWIDLAGIYQPQGVEDVLNGIAYDQKANRLFVTGKNWPNIYQIEIMPTG